MDLAEKYIIEKGNEIDDATISLHILCLLKSGEMERAMKWFQKMKDEERIMTKQIFHRMLTELAKTQQNEVMEKVVKFIKERSGLDKVDYNKIIIAELKNGRSEKALEMIEEMVGKKRMKVDAVIYSNLIYFYNNRRDVETIMKIYNIAKDERITFDSETLIMLLQVCDEEGDENGKKRIIRELRDNGIPANKRIIMNVLRDALMSNNEKIPLLVDTLYNHRLVISEEILKEVKKEMEAILSVEKMDYYYPIVSRLLEYEDRSK